MEKMGTLASPATAFARSVFPVPGGPTRSAPLGIFPPSCVYFFGFFQKIDYLHHFCLASSTLPRREVDFYVGILVKISEPATCQH